LIFFSRVWILGITVIAAIFAISVYVNHTKVTGEMIDNSNESQNEACDLKLHYVWNNTTIYTWEKLAEKFWNLGGVYSNCRTHANARVRESIFAGAFNEGTRNFERKSLARGAKWFPCLLVTGY